MTNFRAIYSSDLNHRARSVYMYLKDRADQDGRCWPAIQTIAKELGLSHKQVRELEAQGKLTIYRMPDEDLDKIQEVAQEYYEEKCAANPRFEKIYRSQQAYIASVSDWSEAATAK